MTEPLKLSLLSEQAEEPQDGWTAVSLLDLECAGGYRRLPYLDESVDAVRMIHLAETLTESELADLANEVIRILKPNCELTLVSPCLSAILDTYALCRYQETFEQCDDPISPLAWLERTFYGFRQGIYAEKLSRVFRQFTLHQFKRVDIGPREIQMTCCKPAYPKCSIVMSTRNKASYLDVTLYSIFAQDVSFPFEIIIVDDGSTDDTREVCRRYPVRYYYLENPRYRNPSVARNVGYRAARGEIIIAQSDDIVHITPDAIERLVSDLKVGEFLLAQVDDWRYRGNQPSVYIRQYCGPRWKKPYFFLGALWRKDLYAAGGCDEDFVEPCWDDNWFADCLMKGLRLKPRWTTEVKAHHQSHAHYHQTPSESSISYGPDTHGREKLSEQLYRRKVASGRFISSGGSWDIESTEPPPLLDRPATESLEILGPIAGSPAEPVVPETVDCPIFPAFDTGVIPKIIENPPLPVAPAPAVREFSTFVMPALLPGWTIPKRMSLFWTGARMSWMRYMTLASFRRWHPDWEMVLYWMEEEAGSKTWKSSETQDVQVYQGPDYSDRLSDLNLSIVPWTPSQPALAAAHACDLCQWSVLAEYGGWYSDMDVLWVGSLPAERVKSASAVVCLSDGYMAIGLMGASPGNPLFRNIQETAVLNYTPRKYQSTGAEAIYRLAGIWPSWGSFNQPGRLALDRLRERYFIEIAELAQETIYPFTYRQTDRIFSEAHDLPPGCCGIHWFGGNNLSQQWNCRLTHENYGDYDNTYTRCARRCLA